MTRRKKHPLIDSLDAEVIDLIAASKQDGVDFKDRLSAFREAVRYLHVKHRIDPPEEEETGINEFVRKLGGGAGRDAGGGTASEAGDRGGGGGVRAGGANSGYSSITDIAEHSAGSGLYNAAGDSDDPLGTDAALARLIGRDRALGDGNDQGGMDSDRSRGRLYDADRDPLGRLRPGYNGTEN